MSNPSDPVELQIVEVIKTRLERISTANGFGFSAVDVVTPNRLGTNAVPKPRSLQVRIGSLTDNEAYDHPGNPPAIGRTLELGLLAWPLHSDSADESRDLDGMRLCAAMRKAITNPPVDPHLWHLFDGLAVDAEFGESAAINAGDGTPVPWGLGLMVHFRVDENDPTNPRA